MPIHPFTSIVLAHLARYPLMQPADLYKLAHQAALGGEHAAPSEAAVRAWLMRELKEMGDGPPEPLLDPITASGRILRVHLRPYLRAGLDPEALLRAFVLSARQIHGDAEELRSCLNVILRLAEDEQLGIEAGKCRLFFSEMESAGWPPVRHSPVFRQAYRPAYRVVARDLLPEEILP